mmetsp:Transcript_16170/g.18314  ORF Transcript_16170/g.18314 Transcript_16170/m.18314 type:complete len:263 (+) Transcript_16170:140-928(+)
MSLQRLLALLSCLLLAVSLVRAAEDVCDAEVEDCSPKQENKPAKSAGSVTEYPMEHSLSYDDGFTSRGKLLVQVMKKKISIKFDSNSRELSKKESSALEKLASEKRFYRVRIPSDPLNPESEWLMASVPACDLALNDFKEYFRFHLDKSGEITSFEVTTKNPSGKCNDVKFPKTVVLKSKAVASIPKEAHMSPKRGAIKDTKSVKAENLPPELAGAVNEAKKQEKKEGESPENQSFIRKYWYIFLPMVLMSFFGGPAEPQKK